MSGQVVDTETGELVQTCSAEEARELTDRIKRHAEALWELLLQAHDRGAWKALGYATWNDYVSGEFAMSKQRSFQVLDQGRVIRAIRDASESTAVDLTEREARDIKPHLEEVGEHVRCAVAEETTGDGPPPDDRVREIVTETVNQHRQREAEREERDDTIRQLNEQGQPDDFDPGENRANARLASRVIDIVEQASALPDADEVVAALGPHDEDYLAPIPIALERLSAIHERLEQR